MSNVVGSLLLIHWFSNISVFVKLMFHLGNSFPYKSGCDVIFARKKYCSSGENIMKW